MLLVQSIGRSSRSGFNVDLSFSPRPRMFSSIRYGYSRTFNDADDALTPPATGTFETEYALLEATPGTAELELVALSSGASPHR